ncbi:unnamed protein product [Closterium sp. Naga37s-1]|nr:unnamed protein product [Closterium sp. Naga37s-1]
MGVTKTHDGAVVSVNGNVEQPADATCMPVTGSGSGGRVGAPVCAPLTPALPRPTGIAVETPMHQVLALHVSGQATCQSTPAQQGVAGRVTALTPALARAVAATPKGGRASTSGWTGVMFNTESGNYYVCIITKGKQQTRLGSYDDKDEAAYAYAAGAVVLRPNQQINSTVELTAEEREALAGCTKDHLKLLVRHRRWNRWREWRAALEGLPVAPQRRAGARRRTRDTRRAVQDVEEVDARGDEDAGGSQNDPVSTKPVVDGDNVGTTVNDETAVHNADLDVQKERLIEDMMQEEADAEKAGEAASESSSDDPLKGAATAATAMTCQPNGDERPPTAVTYAIVTWDDRKGKLTNSPCDNGASVKRLQLLAYEAVAEAIGRLQPTYDAERKSWAWGPHKFRLSSSGLECLLPTTETSHLSEEGGGGDASGSEQCCRD